jgi:hypothetical protein
MSARFFWITWHPAGRSRRGKKELIEEKNIPNTQGGCKL